MAPIRIDKGFSERIQRASGGQTAVPRRDPPRARQPAVGTKGVRVSLLSVAAAAGGAVAAVATAAIFAVIGLNRGSGQAVAPQAETEEPAAAASAAAGSRAGGAASAGSSVSAGIPSAAAGLSAAQVTPALEAHRWRVAITNSGFEGHGAVTEHDGKYQTGLAPAGWTIITDGANGKGGITLDFADTPWVLAGSIPEGGSAVYFQYRGGIKTTVQIPRGGIYRLSFWCAGRSDNAIFRQHEFGVWLGSQQVAVAKTCAAGFERFECVTPYLTIGTYELRFQGIVSSVNRASVIDDVRLELQDGNVSAGLKNGGF